MSRRAQPIHSHSTPSSSSVPPRPSSPPRSLSFSSYPHAHPHASTSTLPPPTPTTAGSQHPSRTRRNSLLPSNTTTSASVADLSTSYTSHNLSHEQLQGLKRQRHWSTLSLSPRRQGQGTSDAGTSVSKPTAKARTRYVRGSNLAAPNGETSYAGREHGQDDGEGQGGGDRERERWTRVDRMRNWRNDAMTQHLYSTAEFWGAKILAITANPDDAFWLAQTHFLTHQYAQAERILTSIRPGSPSARLTDTSLACRYLAAQCQVRLGKWDDALEMVGWNGSNFILDGLDDDVEQEEEGNDTSAGAADNGIKLTASTAHLRGLIHLHLGATDLAKEAFMEALTKDVKCFESFQVLVGSEMMTNSEEWEFIQGLPYTAQTEDDADFIQLMYTVRLKKMTHHEEMAMARQRLTHEFGLGDDPDVMFSLVDELYTSLRFAECYKLTSKILSIHSSHRPTLPIHLSCMHHLPHLRSKLYLYAHHLVDNEPDDCTSWYAVGLWYFSGKRWEESRRYFGKSVLLDSRFGPAWLAFAHSYAFEGEHDQAITAYSTALRHSQGSHLPLLFIGMQHLGLMNLTLAHEYISTARKMCEEDPLANNELGVACFHMGRYAEAINHFNCALVLAARVQAPPSAWAATHLNLGHTYRKLGRLAEAHTSFRLVISLEPRSSSAYAALGMVEHRLSHYQEAIARYHEALSITPGDPVVCDLLNLALEEAAGLISKGRIGFPGLGEGTLRDIDRMVEELEKDVLLGRSPQIGGVAEGIGGEMRVGELRRRDGGGREAEMGLGLEQDDEEEEEEEEEDGLGEDQGDEESMDMS
ncbi:BZ3500_MvSof-1268-A1-R1_Chr6-2g08433 [Microbotryum saponariae]|uniref:BZ3500_MvSof-1268-A1-R1_Chr6-2g08433 protein n=1 Tax=Microbotryum saponariae TaxID=289078 RepID=A0A2X0KNT8_9BASI|nr:BZ3500_MvSof-1268-A1-R1_Chr6-2g08433 [Microbotryum saponariae]SDA07710.1 BZ3501_MvSof-1269-A2-R1_Chr6-1g08147 [Microbotryum saponariae]